MKVTSSSGNVSPSRSPFPVNRHLKASPTVNFQKYRVLGRRLGEDMQTKFPPPKSRAARYHRTKNPLMKTIRQLAMEITSSEAKNS